MTNRTESPVNFQHPAATRCRAANASKRARRRSLMSLETLEERQLLSVISGSGGQGGTTKTLALEPGLNKITFWWENYSIPDEFQILHDGKRIAGDVGLQSGGRSGEIEVEAKGPNDSIVVKVTAPLQGTAWDFRVEAESLTPQLNANGLLGDVIKIDIPKLIAAAGDQFKDMQLDPKGYSLKSNTTPQGKVAQIKDWQGELAKGVFYFVPTVTGQTLAYGAGRSDPGLGNAQLTVVNGENEIPLTIKVTNGFSSSGDGVVTFGTEKLDIYRQQQRLAYLGFPGANGGPLAVDGVAGGNTEHAKRMYSVATATALPTSKTGVLNSGTAAFKANINNANAPRWINMTPITSSWYSGRVYGIGKTGDLLANAQAAAGVVVTAGGSAYKIGNAPPSSSHDAGRGFDMDNIPGPYLFEVVGATPTFRGYVKAPGPVGSIVVRGGPNGYRVGNVNTPADVANAVSATELGGSTTPTMANALDALGLLVYSQPNVADPRAMLQAFVNAGATRIYYNDPRLLGESIGGVTVGFWAGHFNHMHFNIASPIAGQAGMQNLMIAPPGAGFAPMFAAALVGPPGAVDLGQLTATQTVSGVIDAANPERLFRFEIGDPSSFYSEVEYFDTLRDLTITLDGLSEDADLQLVHDVNEDGVFGPDEVFYDSSNPGTSAESISALQFPSGVYYVRVVGRGGDTSFNLTLTPEPLPTPPDGAGETVADAADLGELAGAATRSDFIGEVDPIDLYKFHLSAVSDVTMTLGGLGLADAALAFGRDLDGDGQLGLGEIIAFSDEEGNSDESLRLTLLPAGDYLVQVWRVSGNSDYQLEVSATPSTIPTDSAGETLAAARELGALNGALATGDFVGDIDPIDAYRFSLSALSGLSIRLSALSADADVVLARDANGDGEIDESEIIAASRNAGADDETISLMALPAGDYYLIVNQYEGDTTYDLNVEATPPSGADLVLSRTNPATAPGLGDRFSYTITVTNQGVDAATNVRITDTLPNGLVFVSVAPVGGVGTASGGGNQWTGRIASLAAGASASFTVTAYSFITGALRGVTTATADNEYDASNNSLVAAADVAPIASPPADLSLAQTVDNPLPNVGDQVKITITLTNNGPGTATEIKVKDSLPAGLEYVSSSADLGAYDPATGVWTIGNLPPGVVVDLRITVTMTGSTGVVNTAEVYSVAETDPNSTPNNNDPAENDQASVTIGVVAPTNTAPTLSAIPDQTVDEGTTIQFTAQATDAETPATGLRYSLAPGAPEGATIDPRTGAFSWTPATPGVHVVTVIVKDDGSPALQASRTVTLTALAVAPVVSLGEAPTVYSYVEFATAGSFVDPGVGPYSATVDYGDGGGAQPLTLTEDNTFELRHAYSLAGQYLVTVAVTDPSGLTGTATMIATATGPAPSGFGPVRDAFVTSLYVTLMNRDPEPPGLRFWSSSLAAGARTANVTLRVWSSPERADLLNRGVVAPIRPIQAHTIAMRAARSAIARPIPRGPVNTPVRRPALALNASPRITPVRPALALQQRGPLVRALRP